MCVCSGYSCHSHPQGSAPWSLKGAGQVQDQNGFPRPHPLATWEAARIHSALNASWAFPQLTFPNQRAFTHFTEEEMEAGRDATS